MSTFLAFVNLFSLVKYAEEELKKKILKYFVFYFLLNMSDYLYLAIVGEMILFIKILEIFYEYFMGDCLAAVFFLPYVIYNFYFINICINTYKSIESDEYLI